jgi:hypothetical protein
MIQVDRKRVMLGNEGHIIEFAGNHGEAAATEYARGAIDGCFNALIRLEGPTPATARARATADRYLTTGEQP